LQERKWPQKIAKNAKTETCECFLSHVGTHPEGESRTQAMPDADDIIAEAIEVRTRAEA